MGENDYTREGLALVTWDTITRLISDLKKAGKDNPSRCNENLLNIITRISTQNPVIGEYMMEGFNRDDVVAVTHMVVIYESLRRQAESYQLRDSFKK